MLQHVVARYHYPDYASCLTVFGVYYDRDHLEEGVALHYIVVDDDNRNLEGPDIVYFEIPSYADIKYRYIARPAMAAQE